MSQMLEPRCPCEDLPGGSFFSEPDLWLPAIFLPGISACPGWIVQGARCTCRTSGSQTDNLFIYSLQQRLQALIVVISWINYRQINCVPTALSSFLVR